MKKIGVVVEGPSDLIFWERVLARQFAGQGCLFPVRSLGGRDRLIREAPNLSDDFRKAGYHSALFILDADKAPCASEVLGLFDDSFRTAATQNPVARRFAHICIAFREMESWVLADAACIQSLIGCADYSAPTVDAQPAGKAKLLRLCREHKNPIFTGMENRDFARKAAGCFAPENARLHSPSFDRFWRRVSSCVY
jgi:hypothetical protein